MESPTGANKGDRFEGSSVGGSPLNTSSEPRKENLIRFDEPDLSYLEISSRFENPENSRLLNVDQDNWRSENEEGNSRKPETNSTSQLEPESVIREDNPFDDQNDLRTDSILRKRQPADFLPISGEIKRIGVEISEEHAKQVKNDVRRLSPVLVSLRERTLGEISLTSDSGLFVDQEDPGRSREPDEKNHLESGEKKFKVGEPEIKSPSSQCLSARSLEETDGRLEEIESSSVSNEKLEKSYGEKHDRSEIDSPSVQRKLLVVLSRIDDENSQSCSENHPEIPESRNLVGNLQEKMDENVLKSPLSEGNESNKEPNEFNHLMRDTRNNEKRDNLESPLCKSSGAREFYGEVSKSQGKILEGQNEVKKDQETHRNEVSEELLGKKIDEIDVERLMTSSEVSALGGDLEVKRESKTDIELSVVKLPTTPPSLIPDNINVPDEYLDNDQLRRKSPKVIIERSPLTSIQDISKLSESSSLSEKSAETKITEFRPDLDRVRRTLAVSLEVDDVDRNESLSDRPLDIVEDTAASVMSSGSIEVTIDLPESIDTETETETGSDNSSEIVSIASINSAETRTICDSVTDEAPRDLMTRLESERPETFTEDSAESLTLPTGAGDEVRSDGSDSGLGSEIPGEAGPVPAPESDSETSFLDRIPDDILSDKDKVTNPLEVFVSDAGSSSREPENGESQDARVIGFPTPTKSSLKRRLAECTDGEPSPKRHNPSEPARKKRNIKFDAVTVYYFPRAQGFTCVPSQGGSTLGMSATHSHAERFSLSEHAAEQRRLHRARLAQLSVERASNCTTEAASSSEDPSDDTDEEPSDAEELDIDSYYFLQPVPTWQRRALLRAAGVRRIDAVEKDDCRDIRASREHCGCGCKGYCDPESCACSRANVKCQVDRAGFPCGCSRDGCANTSGRIEFNPVRVRTHFIHTLMRLQLEKKQREEDRTDSELHATNQASRNQIREISGTMREISNNPMREIAGQMRQLPGPIREISAQMRQISGPIREIPLNHGLGPMDPQNSGGLLPPESCVETPGGFTSLHYENSDPNSSGVAHQAREDSLDLYAIRDDCYASEELDSGQNSQRKLHPDFNQAFQTFQQPVHFPGTSGYQDYHQGYQNLASTSSRTQFQSPNFQNVQGNGFYGYNQDLQACQVPHHGYETQNFPHDDTGQQYTNLNSVQPMNAVVQQMGKLEPFSELLSGRYSYYEQETQPLPVSYHQTSPKEPEKTQEENQNQPNAEDCDENFGEIIKKSMVETVSA